MNDFIPIQDAKKDCEIEGDCFARDKFGRCKILIATPIGQCSFQKSREEYAEGIKLYGNGKDYASRRSLKDYEAYRKKRGL